MNILVFGQGKMGTTVIAKTIQHSLPGSRFLMEPKSEEALSGRDGQDHVVKILQGYWQENLPGLTRVLRNESTMRFDRIVKMIRDPRDQAISLLLYQFFGLARSGRASDKQLQELIEIVQAKERSPSSLSFTAFCAELNRLFEWSDFTSIWLMRESGRVANRAYWEYLHAEGGEGYLARYEEFVRGELRELESYLGLKLSPNRDVGEFSRTRRSASWGNWREFFTAEDVAVLRPVIGATIKEMGYPDWELKPVERLNPKHFSGYLVRLIEEAREANSKGTSPPAR